MAARSVCQGADRCGTVLHPNQLRVGSQTAEAAWDLEPNLPGEGKGECNRAVSPSPIWCRTCRCSATRNGHLGLHLFHSRSREFCRHCGFTTRGALPLALPPLPPPYPSIGCQLGQPVVERPEPAAHRARETKQEGRGGRGTGEKGGGRDGRKHDSRVESESES